jgi:hypothetical protein
MPAPVSPFVGIEFGYVLAPVGTSDVPEQVDPHPVSLEFPHQRTAPVTVSKLPQRSAVDDTSGSFGADGNVPSANTSALAFVPW